MDTPYLAAEPASELLTVPRLGRLNQHEICWELTTFLQRIHGHMRFCDELSEAAVLTTESRNSQQVTVLRCYGRLVHGDGAEALRQAVMSQGGNHFAIDLGGVEAVDAAGLGVLVELENWATARGGAIQLLNPTARLLEVLKTTGLNSVLEICTNPRAAGEAA